MSDGTGGKFYRLPPEKENTDYVQNYCKLRKTEIELHKSGMKGYNIVTSTRKNYWLTSSSAYGILQR